MAAVPTKLPTVLRADQPAHGAADVPQRAGDHPDEEGAGHGEQAQRGTKNRNTEARSEPAARGRPSSA